ncbi:MAG: protein translocase subunit SecD [Chloroflexi bacterium]|nr:protein translocase subunit SecD [Chloroflexota bacterium]
MRGYRAWLVLILVVAATAIWMSLPGERNIDVAGITRDIRVVRGLDLDGGSRVLLEAALSDDQLDDDKMDQARLNVERRVNGLGVSEALVQRQGDKRIIVELPGVKDEAVAFEAIKSTGLLEFVNFAGGVGTGLEEGTCILTDARQAIVDSQLEEGEIPDYSCSAEEADGLPEEPVLNNGVPFTTVMTGDGLADAAAVPAQVGTQWQVSFSLEDNSAADAFTGYVAASANQPLAIVLDGRLISAPNIQSDLASSAAAGTMDGGVITGNFTRDEARVLAAQLKYGALPVPLNIVAYDTIGPSLGEISVERSIRAGIIGVVTILIFMLVYYRVPGIAANLALMLFAVINFALFKFIPVTLSLPAITGFLISIGTAVDGNILIFERMKEEIRGGRKMERAIEAGFDRAWTSIRDSNISTIIICFILYFFGNAFGASAVQGFAITLGLGLVINLFTAVVATRVFLHTIVLVAGKRLEAQPRLLGT